MLQVDYLWMVVFHKIFVSLLLIKLLRCSEPCSEHFGFAYSASIPFLGKSLSNVLLGNLCSPNVYGLGATIHRVPCSPKSKSGYGTQARPEVSFSGIYKHRRVLGFFSPSWQCLFGPDTKSSKTLRLLYSASLSLQCFLTI